MHSEISSTLALAAAPDSLTRLVGSSPAIQRLEEAIARVGHVDCPVLLTGETGSGKDEAARAIHAAGSRAARPFVAVNCAGIVGTLAESLLFGHEKGSFTGADEATTGAFRAADSGILFLDEIGELALDQQPKLLRALELRDVVPVGATRPMVEPSAATAPEPARVPPEILNLGELRRTAVRRALSITDGRYGRAAALLGVSAKTMTTLAADACPGRQATRGRRRRKPLPR